MCLYVPVYLSAHVCIQTIDPMNMMASSSSRHQLSNGPLSIPPNLSCPSIYLSVYPSKWSCVPQLWAQNNQLSGQTDRITDKHAHNHKIMKIGKLVWETLTRRAAAAGTRGQIEIEHFHIYVTLKSQFFWRKTTLKWLCLSVSICSEAFLLPLINWFKYLRCPSYSLKDLEEDNFLESEKEKIIKEFGLKNEFWTKVEICG